VTSAPIHTTMQVGFPVLLVLAILLVPTHTEHIHGFCPLTLNQFCALNLVGSRRGHNFRFLPPPPPLPVPEDALLVASLLTDGTGAP
jgi:hypothetical protein